MMASVNELYRTYVSQGMSPRDAAKKIQNETGMSAVTGQPIKQKKISFTKKGIQYGQYPIL